MPRPVTRRNTNRRQTDFFDVEDDGRDNNVARTPTPAPVPTPITVDHLTAMMVSLQQSQAENFERLLSTVLECRSPSSQPAPAHAAQCSPTPPPAQLASGTFATCKSTYSGAPTESLDGFIDALEAFKDCADVTDANALRGLSMLLTHDAATWWQGVKSTITSWSKALQHLRSAFGDSRPPHRIYRELFSKPQQLRERTELYVAKARAQLARLPKEDLSEKVQLDMIYGLLHVRVRERLRREEVETFETLLRKAREIEEVAEENTCDAAPASAYNQRKRAPPLASPRTCIDASARSPSPTHTNSSTTAASVIAPPPRRATCDEPAAAATPPTSENNRFCVYCKRHGHTRENCRRLAMKKDGVDEVSCYGCGERGVVRANCAKCNTQFNAISCEYIHKASPTSLSNRKSPAQVSKATDCFGAENVKLRSSHNPRSLPNNNFLSAESNNRRKYHAIMPKDNCKNNLTSVDGTDFHLSDFFPILPSDFTTSSILNNDGSRVASPDGVSNNPAVLSVDNKIPLYDSDRRQTKRSNPSKSTTKPFNKYTGFSGSSRVTISSNCDRGFSSDVDEVTYELDILELFSTSSHSRHTSASQPRPLLGVRILDLQGTALIDTGAKRSVVGSSLYKLLQERRHPTIEMTMRVKLADGSTQWRQVLTTTLQVDVGRNKSVKLDFLIIPDAIGNETILGIDFLLAAGIVLNFGNSTWKFSDDSQVFAIQYEHPSPSSSCYAAKMPRENESKMLTPAEREKLSSLQQELDDIFRLGGAPLYLKKFMKNWKPRKETTDHHFRSAITYQVGDEVLVTTPLLNKDAKGRANKFMPKRDGPYQISRVVSDTTYDVVHLGSNERVGRFHSNYLTPFHKSNRSSAPIQSRRHRGRPRLQRESALVKSKSPTGRSYDLEGEHVARLITPAIANPGSLADSPRSRRAHSRSRHMRQPTNEHHSSSRPKRRPIKRPKRYHD